jgi:hypothetical protein
MAGSKGEEQGEVSDLDLDISRLDSGRSRSPLKLKNLILIKPT